VELLRCKLELSRGGQSTSLGMEGLRGIAVLLVFCVHFFSQALPYISQSWHYDVSLWMKELGNMGVDLFFILSGYLIYGSLISKSKTNFISYMRRRIRRIYPVFFIVLLIYISISLLVPEQSKLPESGVLLYILKNILLLPGVFDVKPMVTVSWSLSYEMFYYLLIPLVIGVLNLRRWTAVIRLCFWLFIFICGLILFYIYPGPNRLLVFIGGIWLFEINKMKVLSITFAQGVFCGVLAAALYVPVLSIGIGGLAQVILLSVLLPFLCMSVFGYNAGVNSFWSFTPLRWLGNMSYSYYLIHGLVLNVCFLIYGKLGFPLLSSGVWLLMALMLFVTLTASFALFVIVEKPLSLDKNSVYNKRE